MTISVVTSGGEKSLQAIVIRDGGNTPRAIKEMWVRTTAGLKQVFGQLTATLSAALVRGAVPASSTVSVSSRSVTASPVGGVSPFTYSWAKLTGGSWTIDNPTSAATTFTISCAPDTSQTGTFRCTIADATGATATADVTAICTNMGATFGGGSF